VIDSPKLDRLLGQPDLERLVERLAQRIASGKDLSGRLVLHNASLDERSAVAALFGRPLGDSPIISVDLDKLDQVVTHSGAAPSLTIAVQHLKGPIVVRPVVRDQERMAWDAALEVLDTIADDAPGFAEWARDSRTRALTRRLARTPDRAHALLSRVARVLNDLPRDGEALPRLAARTLNSAHALDLGTPEATIVISALSAGKEGDGADGRRDAWARAGVALDELSSTVLVHRLPLPGALGELTGAGEPLVVTLRQLRTLDLVPPRSPVFVCENPSVVDAAARELGEACAPLVCVQGQPSFAADLLLSGLASAGIRYHGDFDWGGLRIANRIHARHGFKPWRFTADDLASATEAGEALTGIPVNARWDESLRPELLRRGTKLEEEQVLGSLLDDLAKASGGDSR
jgi:uncharacterized protein (TIGR02679 family)